MKFTITLATKKPFISSEDVENIRENLRAHIREEIDHEIQGFSCLVDEEPTVDFSN